MKEIIYPQRLRETIVGKGDLSYIRTSYHGAPPPPPPITCTPTKRSFLNSPVNFDLVSMKNVNYEFYTIVETEGQRFFVRVAGNTVPTEPVIGKLYYHPNDDYDSAPEGDLTAAMAIDPFLNTDNMSTSSFNEDYYPLGRYDLYKQFLLKMWYRYDVKPVQTPRESWSLTKLDGLTVSSSIPEDLASEIEHLDLRLNPDPSSFKFCRATSSEMQQYGIVNNSSQRCINIIDYVNGGNELEVFSCAQIGLPTSSNYDDVSPISCVRAPTEYTFRLQDLYSLSDTSGTIQITDSVSGFTKKYLFKKLSDFLSSSLAIDLVGLDFPVYYSNALIDSDNFVIMMEKLEGAPESYFNPLKIIIQMNSPNALFTNNGTNRLAFCLSVESITGGDTGAETPPVISCIPTSFNVTQIQGDTTKTGGVIAVASIWYEGKEYPYITTADQMAYLIPNVTSAKLRFGGGFRTGILMHYDTYNVYPEYCKALVIARNTTDNYFVAGASNDNLVLYTRTASIWDGGGSSDRIFKPETMRAINAPSEIRLTKLSPEMTQFIKTNGGDAGVFLNGRYNVNNLVDMVNQGNDIIINACVKVESNMFDEQPVEPPVEPEPPVISCTPTVFNVTQIQGGTTTGGYTVVGASIWYEGKEYPYIIVAEPMELSAYDVNRTKLNLGGGFSKGIIAYYDAYNVYPEYCKALVITRNTNDNYFIAGAGTNNLVAYMKTASIWDGGGPDRIFKSETMKAINEPSQIRLTKLSPEMTQFIKTYGGYASGFLNGDYTVNNLVDMINQGNDIIINACVKVESNLLPTPPELPPVVTTPPKPAMAIVNMISDTPFISTFKNGFELESYYDAEAGGYRIENENNKIYLRDPAYAPVVSFRPKQGNLMGATQIQGEVYDWKGIGFDISLATPKHLNKIQNIYGLPSNDVVLVMLSQLNEGQSAPPILNGRFVCNPEFE